MGCWNGCSNRSALGYGCIFMPVGAGLKHQLGLASRRAGLDIRTVGSYIDGSEPDNEQVALLCEL
jgi:hypothetical protein